MWSAGIISYAGDGLVSGAMPVIAASITRDPRQIALVEFFETAGWLVVGLLAGVVADRVQRLTLMWRVDLIRALVLLGYVTLVALGWESIALLCGLGLLLGLAAPFHDSAQGSLAPDLVTDEHLERANSLNQVALLFAAMLIAPPIGAIWATASHTMPFLLDAVTFAVAAVLLWRLASSHLVRAHMQPPAPEPVAAAPGIVWAELREGLSYLWRQRGLRTLAIAAGMINGISGGIVSILVLYVSTDLGLPDTAYGFAMALFALGGVLGAVVAEPLVHRLGAQLAVLTSLGSFSAAAFGLGLLVAPAPAALALVIAGFGGLLWNVVTVTYRHRVVPRALLGRVTSTYRLIAFAGMPLGAVLAGFLAHFLGSIPVVYVMGGAALLLTTAFVWPGLRDLDAHSAKLGQVG